MTNKIKEFRQKMGITQDELAYCVGVRRETIVNLERGKYNPSLHLAYDVAKYFNLQIEEIFSFEDEIKS